MHLVHGLQDDVSELKQSETIGINDQVRTFLHTEHHLLRAVAAECDTLKQALSNVSLCAALFALQVSCISTVEREALSRELAAKRNQSSCIVSTFMEDLLFSS